MSSFTIERLGNLEQGLSGGRVGKTWASRVECDPGAGHGPATGGSRAQQAVEALGFLLSCPVSVLSGEIFLSVWVRRLSLPSE